jgi:hypothetical protein
MQPTVVTIKVKRNINISQGFLLKRVAHPLESGPLSMWVRSEDRSVHLRENKGTRKRSDGR